MTKIGEHPAHGAFGRAGLLDKFPPPLLRSSAIEGKGKDTAMSLPKALHPVKETRMVLSAVIDGVRKR